MSIKQFAVQRQQNLILNSLVPLLQLCRRTAEV
eukprot:COSAG04_NODE_2939_length_3368_cov_3.662894_2_plen_33_part_00